MGDIRIVSVVGARPNFMKIAPLTKAIAAYNEHPADGRIVHSLVHTGQHYDKAMSQSFFSTLGIPEPDVDLGIGSGTHAEQVGRTMIAFEGFVREWHPDWVVVVGDVNATCACAITAKKEHLQLAHIEAGLRSFDLRMPEEINRMVTDRLTDLYLTPDTMADENLLNEGVDRNRIHFVGNIMIDTLEANLDRARDQNPADIVARQAVLDRPALKRFDPARYALLTLHRPSNVDDPRILAGLIDVFRDVASTEMPVVWTLHPRTRNQLQAAGLWDTVAATPGLFLVKPLAYHDMLRMNLGAAVMLTDSGGLQEECCVLGTPCITLRENTERPVTLRQHGGVSELAGNAPKRIRECFEGMKNLGKVTSRPPLWDGHTAERIVDIFAGIMRGNAPATN